MCSLLSLPLAFTEHKSGQSYVDLSMSPTLYKKLQKRSMRIIFDADSTLSAVVEKM